MRDWKPTANMTRRLIRIAAWGSHKSVRRLATWLRLKQEHSKRSRRRPPEIRKP